MIVFDLKSSYHRAEIFRAAPDVDTHTAPHKLEVHQTIPGTYLFRRHSLSEQSHKMLPAFSPPLALPNRARVVQVQRARPRVQSPRTPRMQTWSDPAVTQEYMDYISGNNQREAKEDCQSTIVGAGRIGEFLREQGNGNDLLIHRGEQIPPDAPGPVYVCTRNDDLEDIIINCPEEKKEDLVFLQNGYLEKLLRRHNVSDNTKANIYFAVTKIGADPVDGITETNPEGLTSVCGKWEGAFSERVQRAGMTCKIVKERDFRRGQLEKLIWISVFNLIGAVHGNISMGEVSEMHVKEVTEMSIELATMVRFTLTVGMLPNIEKRLLAYGKAVKRFPTALKEFKWRNGFFYDYSMLARKNGFPDPTPMHTGYLEDGKEMGILKW